MSSDLRLPVDPAHSEPAGSGLNNRLNWLRAGVLGANDGIVSTAGIVMGVAGATTDRSAILIAGVAGLVAGALSMAAGEYVSVSTQRDAELALLEKERRELRDMPEEEFDELQEILASKGLSDDVAHQVATQLTERNALKAHAVLELGIDPDDITNPWHAAFASMTAFIVGALLPLLTILLPDPWRIGVTVVAVVCALAVTGWISARLGYAHPVRAVLRNVAGGALAMAVTYVIGSVLGTTIA
jgi:vacuolar iron transporter family protein